MKQHESRPSIDGFTLQRRSSTGSGLQGRTSLDSIQVPARFLRSEAKTENVEASGGEHPQVLARPSFSSQGALTRADIDESLRAVDEQPVSKDKKNRKRKPWFKRVKLLFALGLVVLVLGGAVFFVNKFIAMAGRVFSGNVFDLLGSGVELREDTKGRTNILLFGTSEDDASHQGAALTDSIMLLSIDKAGKKAMMVSMPRDMWVTLDTPCTFGTEQKINVVYECAGAIDGDLGNIDVAKGAKALQDKVGEIFGFDIQYYVKVNYSVVRDLTTALGGVTVTVESADPRGLYDYNTKLKLSNGPATLQGEQALAFVRARGDGGGYGFEGSNFVREQNQQKVLIAIRDKAMNVGTLTNPVALSGLIDSLGNNIRTNFSTGEIKTLAKLGKDISGEKVVHISLVDAKHPVVTTAMYNAQSIVRPIAGLYDYSKIQSYIQGQMNGGSVETEDASIIVLNGSGVVGAAAKKQTELTTEGLLNITVGDTSYVAGSSVVWYDTTGGKKPKTQEKLSSVLGKQPAGTNLPAGVESTSDFVILLGKSK